MSESNPPDETPVQNIGLAAKPEQLAGCWSNLALVKHSPYEFTIDFCRADFDDDGNPVAGVLVQRVNMSPLFIQQLIEALQANWEKYSSRVLKGDLPWPTKTEEE